MKAVHEDERERRSPARRGAERPPAPPQAQLASAMGNQAFAAMVQRQRAMDVKVPQGAADAELEAVTDARTLARDPDDGGSGATAVAPASSAVPAGGGSAAPSPVTVKLPPHIRSTSSPAGMADRIAPRVDTAAHVDVSGVKPGDPPIVLSIEGAGGGNGTATIDGAATKSVTGSGDVALRGVDQTDVGKGGNLKLVAKQGAATLATSAGFTVSAIPQNYNDVFARLLTGTMRGIVVSDSWESDSGVVGDLKETEISEQVEVSSSSGCFAGTGKLNSGYLPGDQFSEDQHGSPVASLTGKGHRVAEQTCMFKDKRSGSNDIPMTKSGYTITRDVRTAAAGGGLEIQTTKVGASTSANGVASAAGAGSIDKTQPV